MGARDMYAVGDFKNGEFVQCQEIRKLHYGEYVYAGQTVSNMPQGRTVRITWDRGCVKTDRICGEMNIPVELEVVVVADTDSIEVYFDGGISYAVMKNLYCANSPSNLKISSDYDYSLEKLEINELSSVWSEGGAKS